MIACIDLFCGVGGLTHGLLKGGVKVVAGVDIDPQCRYPYESNNQLVFVEADVRNLSGRSLNRLWPAGSTRLLAGCAPCQPFSTYSRSSRTQRVDSKWALVSEFARLVREAKPDLVTMENVPQLLDHEVFHHFLSSLEGYSIWWNTIQCQDYGVPQTRKRLVLLASRLGEAPLKLTPVSKAKNLTVRKTIAHLRELSAGEADPSDPMHAACSLSSLNLQRIKSSKQGGSWRDWDSGLLAKCHTKASGFTYPSVYGRMAWDAPAPTITTQSFGYGNGRFGHPEQDRAITLREAALLQTFPEAYKFLKPGERLRYAVLGRLIGNAVPVKIGVAIAKSFTRHIALLPPVLSTRARRQKEKTIGGIGVRSKSLPIG